MNPRASGGALCRVHRQTEVREERLDLQVRLRSGVRFLRRRPRGPPTEVFHGGLNDHALAPQYPDHRRKHLGRAVAGQLHTEGKLQGNECAGTHAERKPVIVGGQHGAVKEGIDDVLADKVIAQRKPRRVLRQAVLRDSTDVNCTVVLRSGPPQGHAWDGVPQKCKPHPRPPPPRMLTARSRRISRPTSLAQSART